MKMITATAFRFAPIALLGSLVACGSQPQQPPSWILNPVGAGIVATGCTPSSGVMNVDRQVALANARTALAQEIEVQVDAVAELVTQKTGDTGASTSFSSVSRQQAQQTLRMSQPTRVEIVQLDGKQQLCALVELNEQQSRQFFNTMMAVEETGLSPADKNELFAVFVGNG